MHVSVVQTKRLEACWLAEPAHLAVHALHRAACTSNIYNVLQYACRTKSSLCRRLGTTAPLERVMPLPVYGFLLQLGSSFKRFTYWTLQICLSTVDSYGAKGSDHTAKYDV